ncbi:MULTISPECIES: fucose isomerase [unclassified Clostridium]|uniref:L-fucose/L-arabinose isomerase family protein n=1 Tax=unclassified Clostridium TaxID=2614128 RepID=UPI001105D4D4|nr:MULTISPECIES: fucose isomerase [unclassified Clostridium]
MVYGVIVSNRSFFPDHLVEEGRAELLALLKELGHEVVTLTPQDTELGAVETVSDGDRCAALFKSRQDIEGIICCLPNFGDEVAVSTAIRRSGLNVPVLVQACDDALDKMDLANRRDAFCGKLSLCSVLRQNGIPYTLTQLHTCAIRSPEFRADLERFAGICRVVNGLRRARIAAIGTRPTAFQTVRYSEKLLQRDGIYVTVCDMAEMIGRTEALKEEDPRVVQALQKLADYAPSPAAKIEERTRIAKLYVAVKEYLQENNCDAGAVQCWDALEKYYHCAPCVVMSMLGQEGIPLACEMDVMGAVSMLALRLAASLAPGYMDWDNNYGDDRDKCVNVHCSNYPKDFFGGPIDEVGHLDILGTTLGRENCFGACKGRVAPGEMTFMKASTDEFTGKVRAYMGKGEFTDDPLNSFGGVAVCHVPGLQKLLHTLAEKGFEHHVAMTRGDCLSILREALGKYMSWELTVHEG